MVWKIVANIIHCGMIIQLNIEDISVFSLKLLSLEINNFIVKNIKNTCKSTISPVSFSIRSCTASSLASINSFLHEG